MKNILLSTIIALVLTTNVIAGEKTLNEMVMIHYNANKRTNIELKYFTASELENYSKLICVNPATLKAWVSSGDNIELAKRMEVYIDILNGYVAGKSSFNRYEILDKLNLINKYNEVTFLCVLYDIALKDAYNYKSSGWSYNDAKLDRLVKEGRKKLNSFFKEINK